MGDNNPHAGHRSRLKNRFLSNGLKGFEEHNVLELLLFFGIPRSDTNEIAHALINRFGSFNEVLEAPFEEICKVKGVSEHCATLIKLLPAVSEYYLLQRQKEKKTLKTSEEAAEYLISQYMFEKSEVFSIICLDSSCHFLRFDKLSEGSVNLTEVNMRKAMDVVMKAGASCIVLAHNHPGGNTNPSIDDLSTTRKLCDAFKMINVKILDHIIVSGDKFTSLINSQGYSSVFK